MKTFKLLSFAVLAMAISLASCSGEDGERGPQGLAGEDGADGINGTNGVDGQDGQDGVDGQDGEDKPNVSFYFQDGFKAYDGTQDAQISDAFGDSNGVITRVSFDINNPGDERYSVLRFDGISDMINQELLKEGESCEDSYEISDAILYLYCSQTISDSQSSLYVHFGFYGGQDPLFQEDAVSWEMANALDPWFLPGGRSELFEGPFPGTDDYSFKISDIASGVSGTDPGWMAFRLPRSLVKSWVCDSENIRNKGMRLRLSGESTTDAVMIFLTSESDTPDLRPLLVIETEKIDSQSGKGSVSNTKEKDWESMTQEEKMAPLHQYLEMKKSN